MAQEVLDEQIAGGWRCILGRKLCFVIYLPSHPLFHATAEEVLGKLDGPLSPQHACKMNSIFRAVFRST